MTGTGNDRELRAWAARAWPEHDWSAARLAHGAFHEVLLLPTVVARVATGDHARQRTERESALLGAVTALGLPVGTPAVLGPPVHAAGRSGQRTTVVTGEHREQAPWPEVRDGFAALLAGLCAVPLDAGVPRAGLPGPRQWCGGSGWPQLVAEQLVPRLGEAAGAAADRAVAEVLAVERGVVAGFVHGDLGPHNVLWAGRQISGLIDLDHAAWADPAIDVAPLVGRYGARQVAEIVPDQLLHRAMVHRASLSLQVAAAAELAGRDGLRDHALRNFSHRLAAGTLHDPNGHRPGGSGPGAVARPPAIMGP